MWRAWFGCVLLAAACTFEPASLPVGATDGPVVVDGPGVDVPANAADAVPGIDAPRVPDAAMIPDAKICIPGCVSETSLRVCPSDTIIDCVLGCVSSGTVTPHCGVQVPSNAISSNVYNGTGPFVVPAGRIWRADADTGGIVDSVSGPVRAQGTGVIAGIGYFQIGNMGVFSASLITIEATATLRGFGVRALAMVTSGNAVIDGHLDVSGNSCNGVDNNQTCPGPGGGLSGITGRGAGGCGPGGPGQVGGGPVDETGGGGGGFGAGGAAGGDVVQGDGSGGDAGSMCGTDDLVPLVGGSGGGHGGNGGNGGGGGGVVQITSFGQIIVSGQIRASGAGGLGSGGGDGAGGGGAGGGILLEAPTLTLSPGSIMAANGGGGGAGNGGDGQDGLLSNVPAPGGTGGFVGGAGGALSSAAVPGGRGPDSPPADGTGAGGGGVGRIRQNFATRSSNGTIISPAASVGKVPVQ